MGTWRRGSWLFSDRAFSGRNICGSRRANNLERFLEATQGKHVAGFGEEQRTEHVLVNQRDRFAKRGHVPKFYAFVVAAGDQGSAVGRKNHAVDRLLVTGQAGQFVHAWNFTNNALAIGAAGRQKFAVRGKSARGDQHSVPLI